MDNAMINAAEARVRKRWQGRYRLNRMSYASRWCFFRDPARARRGVKT